MLYCLFEVPLCFVVLPAFPAHFSEFVSGIRIVGVRSKFLLELFLCRDEVFLGLALPESSYEAPADAIVNGRPIRFDPKDLSGNGSEHTTGKGHGLA